MHSPTCSQLHLGLIPYGLPKVQLPLYKLDKVKFRGAHLFLFCNWGSKEVLLLGHAQCSQKNCWLVNQYGSYKKKQKSFDLTHDLINMNHTLCPQNLIINHHQKKISLSALTLNHIFSKKHGWCPSTSAPLKYRCWVCNEFKAKFHHSRDFITPILSGNWADMRKEMQSSFVPFCMGDNVRISTLLKISPWVIHLMSRW